MRLIFVALVITLFGWEVGARDVTLAWDPSDGPVQGYTLYYGHEPNTYTERIDAGNRTVFTVTDLDSWKKYYFAATAYGEDSESGFSNEVQLAAIDLPPYAGVSDTVLAAECSFLDPGGSRITDGLILLYTFDEGQGTKVFDRSEYSPALDLTADAALNWLPGGGLNIKTPTSIRSTDPATKIYDAVQNAQELTVEVWVTPANLSQGGPARIVAFSKDSSIGSNFVLGQDGDTYVFRLRDSADPGGRNTVRGPAGSASLQETHVVMTRDTNGSTALYVNGKVAASASVASAGLTSWNASYRFTLANETEIPRPTSHRPWLGILKLAAVYNRALTQAEVVTNLTAGD